MSSLRHKGVPPPLMKVTHPGQHYDMLCGELRPLREQAEGQRAEQQQVAAEKQVLNKLDKIKLDQGQRAAALEAQAAAEELQVRHLSTLSKFGSLDNTFKKQICLQQ